MRQSTSASNAGCDAPLTAAPNDNHSRSDFTYMLAGLRPLAHGRCPCGCRATSSKVDVEVAADTAAPTDVARDHLHCISCCCDCGILI